MVASDNSPVAIPLFHTWMREGYRSKVENVLISPPRCLLGANINAQTEETQETALTLACCGGFLEVADFLIKAGGRADIELGCSTPLMEAAQEGHLELVKYLLSAGECRHPQQQIEELSFCNTEWNGLGPQLTIIFYSILID